MAFGNLARCNLTGTFVTAVASIALALLGFSFMAPLWGTVIGAAIAVGLLVVRWRTYEFLPSIVYWLPRCDWFRRVLSSTVIINVFYSMAPQFILARILDFSAVGLYGRATNVTQVFEKVIIQVLNPVIMPVIFNQIRTGGDLKRMYLNAIELIAVLQWPLLITFALMADKVILFWLGSTWSEIVPLIQMLCVASLSLFAACLTYPVLVAVGRVRDTLISSLISLPPSLIAIFVASFFGIQAVAASALLTLPFQASVAFYFVSKHLEISPLDLFRATFKSALVTLCCTTGAMMSILMVKFDFIGPILQLLLGGTFGLIGWILGLIMTKHPLLVHIRIAANGIVGVMPNSLSSTIGRRFSTQG